MRSFPTWSVVAALLAASLAGCSRPAKEGVTEMVLGAQEAHGAEVRDPRPPARSERLDAEARAWVEETLAAMTLRQRVGQLVVPWISGAPAAADPREFARMLREVEREEVGGLIVSRGRPRELAAKLDAAQQRARVPLLVVSDLETGPGMRLSPGGTDFPPAMAFGAAGDEGLAREAGRVTAAEARAVGIHLTLGPVLDVNSNPDNPIINVRSFGEDPERVARLATAWMLGAREGGLLSAGKHFPGHGDTEVDSHIGLAAIGGDSARLERVELVPFRRAVGNGIDGLLVGHIAVIGLEGAAAPPASLSERIVGGLLRGRLGFQGLVFTDALNMGAVTRRHPTAEAAVLALRAGADVLLQPPGTADVIDRVVEAVETGRLPAERIERSARRMLAAKAAAGLHRRASVAPDSIPARVGVPEHETVAGRVAQASITLAKDPRGLVPLSSSADRIIHVIYTRSGEGSAGEALHAALAAAGLRIERARVGRRTPARAYAALRDRALVADLVLVTVAVAPHQYRELEVPDELSGFVEALSAAGRPVVTVSLGTPYLLDAFPSVPAFLLAWSDADVSQRAAARALLGEAPIRGRLPVSVPPYLAAGDGVDR